MISNVNTQKTVDVVMLLNSTGIPFQDWVAATVRSKSKNYHYEVEVPYSVRDRNKDISGTIDVVAIRWPDGSSDFSGYIVLVVEAKRADPLIKNWIFIKDNHKEYHKYYNSSFISVSRNSPGNIEVYVENGLTFGDLGYPNQKEFDKCTNAFEYNDQFKLNRNSEEKIYKSMIQVHQGLNGFDKNDPIIQKHRFNKAAGNGYIYLPVLVTTADLFTAEYDSENVGLPAGNIDEDKTLITPRQWITYEFPLPEYLTSDRLEDKLMTKKLTTFVVNAAHWGEFLNKVQSVYGFGGLRNKYIALSV